MSTDPHILQATGPPLTDPMTRTRERAGSSAGLLASEVSSHEVVLAPHVSEDASASQSALVDVFLPDVRQFRSDPSGEALRRARLAVIAALAVMGSQLAGIGYSIMEGLWLAVAMMTLALGMLAGALVLLRRGGRVAASGNLIAGALFIVITVMCVGDRGVETPLVTGNAAVILLATLLAGPRAGLLWTAASFLEIWGLYLAYRAGFEFPHMLDRPGEILNAAMVLGTMICVVAAIGVLYEKLHLRSISALDLARRRAQSERRRADQANTAKSAFLANMSHELRTPLNAIIGYSELIKESAEEGEELELGDIDRILLAARHQLSLINDVLDLSKIEAGRMELVVEPVDIAGLVDEVAHTIRPAIEKHGNTFTLAAARELGSVISDATKIRQILLNLLSNAGKFTKQGNVTLTVTRDARVLTFAVRDTGIGIPEQRQKALFRPFTQASTRTSRTYGGTGLGLAITRHYCQMLGGTITLNSVHGQGSTFTVTLATDLSDRVQAGESGVRTGGGGP